MAWAGDPAKDTGFAPHPIPPRIDRASLEVVPKVRTGMDSSPPRDADADAPDVSLSLDLTRAQSGPAHRTGDTTQPNKRVTATSYYEKGKPTT